VRIAGKPLVIRYNWWYAITGLIIFFGFVVRLKGLGKWPLAADEYYIAKSVQNILETGLPKFEFGGFYLRGLLYQYLAAPLVYLFSNDEFALRLVPLLSNMLALPALFLLSRRISVVPVACVTLAYFSLSIWEIEFARFARMYAPFQALFIWYVYFLYRAFFEQNKRAAAWMHGLSLAALFLHEAGIFLLVLNFLPLIKKHNELPLEWRQIFAKAVLLLIGVLFISIDFRYLGRSNFLPAEFAGQVDRSMIIQAPFLISAIAKNFQWMLPYCILLAFCGYTLFVILREKELVFWSKLAWTMIVILSIFNQFGLLLMIGGIALLLGLPGFRQTAGRPNRMALTAVGLNFVFFLAFGVLSSDWAILGSQHAPPSFENLLEIFFKFPDLYNMAILPWFQVLPVLTALSAGLIFWVLATTLARKSAHSFEGFYFLCAVCLIAGIFVGMANTKYITTRYTFFLYPLVILLAVESLFQVSKLIGSSNRRVITVFLFFAVLLPFVTKDFNLTHLLRVDSPEINFRTAYGEQLSRHYYSRQDYRSPAEVVNANMEFNDGVVTTVTPVDYYLKQLDYIFVGIYESRFSGVSACGGTRELWTNASLLYKDEQLFDLINNFPRTIWLIAKSENMKKWFPVETLINEKYRQFLFSRSIDGKINVYKIPAKIASTGCADAL